MLLTWLGNSGNLSEATNWSPARLPTVADNVVIPETPTGGNWPDSGVLTAASLNVVGEIHGGTVTALTTIAGAASGTAFRGSVVNNGQLTGGSVTGILTNNGQLADTAGMQSVTNTATGTILSGSYSCPITNEGNIDGGSFSGPATSSNTINGGAFSARVTNSGTIMDGHFQVVHNDGSIAGGVFSGDLQNDGTVSGGTFEVSCTVTNNEVIAGGTIQGSCTNAGSISGGSFSGRVDNFNTLAGGSFTAFVYNKGSISAGVFEATSTVSNSGNIAGGSFKGSLTNNKNMSGGSYTSSAYTRNYGSISGGMFGGEVYNGGLIEYGEFSGNVYNYGQVTGGSYVGEIYDVADPAPGPDIELPDIAVLSSRIRQFNTMPPVFAGLENRGPRAVEQNPFTTFRGFLEYDNYVELVSFSWQLVREFDVSHGTAAAEYTDDTIRVPRAKGATITTAANTPKKALWQFSSMYGSFVFFQTVRKTCNELSDAINLRRLYKDQKSLRVLRIPAGFPAQFFEGGEVNWRIQSMVVSRDPNTSLWQLAVHLECRTLKFPVKGQDTKLCLGPLNDVRNGVNVKNRSEKPSGSPTGTAQATVGAPGDLPV